MVAIIVGGGVGGLATAIGLGRAGVRCVVLEQSESLRFGGFGLTLQPNALKALDVLGAAEPVRRIGRPMTSGTLVFQSGAVGSSLTWPEDEAGLAVDRSRLLEALLECLAPLQDGPVTLRTGARVESVRDDGERIVVTLHGGETLAGEVLLGADGLHSRVREHLRGPEPPRYSGYTVWRGMARGAHLDTSRMCEIWGRGERFGLVPLSDELIYWFAAANAPEGGADGPDPIAELQARFAGWPDSVREALAATAADEMMRLDCVDRAPIDRWTEGRIALLGDAAHPMTPNMGQGACQAIEDAATLARLLPGQLADPAAALRAYEQARRDRANEFVRRSWSFGRLGQRSGRVACALRNTLMRLAPTGLMQRAVRRTWEVEFPA